MTLECELVKDVDLVCELETGGAEAKTQSKTVTPTASPQTVYPDSGYYLSSVQLTEPLSQSKTVASAVNQQTVLPDEGYLLSSVTVDGMPTETAEVTPTEQTQTVTPSEGKLLSEVAVEPIPSQYKDTSDATATAADINLGKTAYVAGGEVVGANDYVKPETGFYFLDFDDDGYPHTIVIVRTGVNTGLFRGLTSGSFPLFTSRITDAIVIPRDDGLAVCSSQFNVPINVIFKSAPNDRLIVGNNGCSNNSKIKTVIFEGNVIGLQADAFNNNRTTELYDFSHCTGIPTLGDNNSRCVSHASGCIFRVPQSLLSDWQNADAWKDLTDVVWEGV